MDQTLLIQQGLIGSVVPIVVNWLKGKFPKFVGATPIQTLFVVWVLVTACTWAACLWTQQNCTWAQIQEYAVKTALFTQAIHSILKTDASKLSLGLPSVTVTKPQP